MHKESDFEHSIEQSLLQHGGYNKGDPLAYDKKLAIFADEVVAFVQDTQPEFWERFSALNNGNAKAVLIESLVRELRTKGMLSILRSGFITQALATLEQEGPGHRHLHSRQALRRHCGRSAQLAEWRNCHGAEENPEPRRN